MKKKPAEKKVFFASTDMVEAIAKGKSIDKKYDKMVKKKYKKDIEVLRNKDKYIWRSEKK